MHTLERFRECFYRPLVSSTENFERWKKNGANDTAARANEIWKKTLEEYEKPPIDADLEAELKAFVDRRRTGAGGLRCRPIGDVMSTTLLTVDATESLTDAAAQMDARGVGAALVMNGERLSGILTERDVLHAVATGGIEGTKVGAWMTHDPDIGRTGRAAGTRRGDHDPRRLPAPARWSTATRPIGIISIRDLMRLVIDDEAPKGG